MELKLGEKIRLRRKQLGLTLKELAGDRVTAAQISAIEKGKCNPSPGLLNYISKELKVEPEYFMLSEEERNRKKFEGIKDEAQGYISKEDYTEASRCMEKARNIMGSLTDAQKGFYYEALGNSRFENGSLNEAFYDYIKAVTYYDMAKQPDQLMEIYLKMGTCLVRMNKYAVAPGYYKTVIANGDRVKNKDAVKSAMHNIALCYAVLGRFDEAAEYIGELEKFVDYGDEKDRDKYLHGIAMIKGTICFGQEKYNEGLEWYGKAIEIYKSKNDIMGLGRAENNYGECLVRLGKTEEAIGFFQNAIKYEEQMNDSTLVESYLCVAGIYERQGQWDKALETVNSAEEYILAKDLTEPAGRILSTKFRCLYELEMYDKAEIFAFLALDCMQKNHDIEEEVKLYLLISKMYEKMGDEKNALTYLTKADKLI